MELLTPAERQYLELINAGPLKKENSSGRRSSIFEALSASPARSPSRGGLRSSSRLGAERVSVRQRGFSAAGAFVCFFLCCFACV